MSREIEAWIKRTDFRALCAYDIRDVPGAVWIPLANGGYTLISSEDGDWARSRRSISWRMSNAKPYVGIIHRVLMKCPKGKQVDHVNDNTFDNRRSNLRIVNGQSEQEAHKSKRKGPTTSKFKGVLRVPSGTWVACIKIGLGSYKTREEAERTISGIPGGSVKKPHPKRSRSFQAYRRRQKGGFTSEREAAIQYDVYAWEHWRSLEPLNFPEMYANAV